MKYFIENEKKNSFFRNYDFESLIAKYSDILHSAFENQNDNKYIVIRTTSNGQVQELIYNNIFDALIIYSQNKNNQFFIDRKF